MIGRLDDIELIYYIKTGHEQAFVELYNRHWETVHASAYILLRNEAEAMDVLQDVFKDVWEKRNTLSDIRAVRAYLSVAAKNKARNILKRKNLHNTIVTGLGSSENHVKTPEEILELRDQLHQIQLAINKIPQASTREALYLFHVKGLDNDQIAQRLGIDVHSCRRYICRGRDFLCSILKKSH
ncbi:RNA polymerase sigma factor [Chitinophaga rhizophila]|uniref:Sigma-70 family RNA polymerase sigma factor n=1 Tax=Chitinophaga rhizophila TaxID=2866212 RepID=A0ABS7G848_9BACT|nr:sigma-70 family RNA polymerase sigma factor [Chitinophaga rhizophila]MBW8683475.1 sigma-70 family RNA polymerase sigma factor [Chitinophaga rhizophila]